MSNVDVLNRARLEEAANLYSSGHLAQARMLYERILESQPRDVEALHQLGVIAGRSREFERAAELLAKVVEIAPERVGAANDLGVALRCLDRPMAALASYDRAIAIRPDFAEALNNRANLLRQLGHFEAALAGYDRAIVASPRYAEAHHNRGVLLNDLARWEEALTSYERAIELRPDYANAYCNRGVPLEHLDRLESALASYDRAIAINGALTQAYINRGNVLRQLQRPAEAVASCNRALAQRPDDAQAHLNKALAQLAMGDLPAGWREYEWRWKVGSNPSSESRRHFSQPPWLGTEPLTGKTLLIYSEQGMGDTLQFCRYVTLAAQRGARVVFEVQQPLKRLLHGLDGVEHLIVRGEPLPSFDLHCPLLSLPLAFNTTLSSVPAAIPYLRSLPRDRKFWSEKIGSGSKPRIGLVWSGGFRPDQPEIWSVNNRRNIPLRMLEPLNHPELEFYSLQKGQPAEAELVELADGNWNGPRIIDHTSLLHDFADTAALIEQMDLIISVDTSTAHLAGAMGKPVWLLDRFDTCWRWMLGRTDSPWYPSAKIYRQDRVGDWSAVVLRMQIDLLKRFC